MLASGSVNDGAGSPTCSIGTCDRSTVESILAHFGKAQAPHGPHGRRCVHARALAARTPARALGFSPLRGPADARAGAGARRVRGRAIAPGATPRQSLEPR